MQSILTLYRENPTLLVTVATIFGLLIGSFLNVAALRIPLKQSVIHPPSHCTSCRHRLGPLDLVPVFSYVWLAGKCRYCGAKFSPAYALVEALTAALFGFLAWKLGFTAELAVGMLLSANLIVITLTDLRHRIIPDKVVLFGIAAAILLRLVAHPLPLWDYAIAFFAGSGILYLLAYLSLAIFNREGMGGGDIKLFAFLGLILGIKLTLLTLFLASLLGVLYGFPRFLSKRREHSQEMPFGPFIAVGAFLSYIFGNQFIAWYIKLLFH